MSNYSHSLETIYLKAAVRGRGVGIKKEIKKPLLDPNTEEWSHFLCFPAGVTYLRHSHALSKAGALRMLNKVPASRAPR